MAAAVTVEASERLADAVAEVGLVTPTPVLVVVGGAGEISDDDSARVSAAFVDAVAPAAAAAGAVVVDGGTDSGVMRLMGSARAATGGEFPLVGVVVESLVRHGEAALEPRHTHFLLVPGEAWGDEAPWLAETAAAIAGAAASVTVLANGGEVSWRDARLSVERGRPVVVLAGTGRAADELAEGESARARDLRASGLVRSVRADGAEDIAEAVLGLLRR